MGQYKQIHSFKKGFNLIPHKDLKRVKDEIMSTLGITARSQWYRRLYGNVIPNVEEKAAIEKIFTKYKVKVSDIWGE